MWGRKAMNNRIIRTSHWQNRDASGQFQPPCCLYEQNEAAGHRRMDEIDTTRPRVPSKRYNTTAGKSCLQESRRRRLRSKPFWFSSTNDAKKELSKVDLSKPALSRSNKPQLEHNKPTKLTDTESVKLKQGKNFIDKRGIYVR